MNEKAKYYVIQFDAMKIKDKSECECVFDSYDEAMEWVMGRAKIFYPSVVFIIYEERNFDMKAKKAVIGSRREIAKTRLLNLRDELRSHTKAINAIFNEIHSITPDEDFIGEHIEVIMHLQEIQKKVYKLRKY